MKRSILCILLILATVSTVHAQTTKTVTLNWTASASANVSSYNIYAQTVTATPCPTTGFTLLGNVAAPTVTFTDAPRPEGNVVCYTLTAVNSSGLESADSNIVTVDLRPPSPPTGVTATLK